MDKQTSQSLLFISQTTVQDVSFSANNAPPVKPIKTTLLPWLPHGHNLSRAVFPRESFFFQIHQHTDKIVSQILVGLFLFTRQGCERRKWGFTCLYMLAVPHNHQYIFGVPGIRTGCQRQVVGAR